MDLSTEEKQLHGSSVALSSNQNLAGLDSNIYKNYESSPFRFLLFTLFFFIVEHHKKQLQSSRTFFNIILLDCCDYSQHKISVVL